MDALGLGFGFGIFGLWELTGWLLSFPGIAILILTVLVLSEQGASNGRRIESDD
jgi:hypothetical protein